jgi:thiamine kinase-like enzyme
LAGGYVAPAVYKLDLEFRLKNDESEVISFVYKFTHTAEVRVMKRLTDDLHLAEVPTLVAYDMDKSNPRQNGSSWFISPFYEGSLLTFEDDLPPSIIRALAAIHAYYASRLRQLSGLQKMDVQFINYLVDYVLASLDENKARLPDTIFQETQLQLNEAKNNPLLKRAVKELPKTLTHGDVHSGNIIRTAAGKYILFDWGNAKIAPAMLDLANIVEMDSKSWKIYLEAWRKTTGETLDFQLAHLGYYWATAMVNIQYLPFAISNLPPDRVQAMAA